MDVSIGTPLSYMQLPYKILGAPGSPYSRKLRAAIRYRRLPYIWANRNGSEDVNTPDVPVNLLPVLVCQAKTVITSKQRLTQHQFSDIWKMYTKSGLSYPVTPLWVF